MHTTNTDRAKAICKMIQKNPTMPAKKIAESIGLAPSTMYHSLKSQGLSIKALRKNADPASDGGIEHPDRPKRKPITVNEWATKPIRSNRHTNIQYQNGVTG